MSTNETDQAEQSTDSDLYPNNREEYTEWANDQVEEKQKRRQKASAPIDFESETRNGEPLRTGSQLKVLQFYNQCISDGRDEMAEALEDADTFSAQKRLRAEFSRELAAKAGMQFGPKDDGIRRL